MFQVGTGRFQWLMLAICGLANASDAVEVMSVGLMGTAAEQDLQLDAQREGALNSAMLVGMFVGGIGWGLLGDRIGESPLRKVIPHTAFPTFYCQLLLA